MASRRVGKDVWKPYPTKPYIQQNNLHPEYIKSLSNNFFKKTDNPFFKGKRFKPDIS